MNQRTKAASDTYMETLTDLRLKEGGGFKVASQQRRALDAALAAADAVMFSDEAVEELERVLTMHHVITDGLAEGSGWCSQCGNVGDDNEAHLARAVIAALKGGDA